MKALHPGSDPVKINEKSLSTPLGMAMGEDGFDTNAVYVTVNNGIVKLPIE